MMAGVAVVAAVFRDAGVLPSCNTRELLLGHSPKTIRREEEDEIDVCTTSNGVRIL